MRWKNEVPPDWALWRIVYGDNFSLIAYSIEKPVWVNDKGPGGEYLMYDSERLESRIGTGAMPYRIDQLKPIPKPEPRSKVEEVQPATRQDNHVPPPHARGGSPTV